MFGESDPIGLEGGIDIYSYAAANPLTLIDPSGHIPIVVRVCAKYPQVCAAFVICSRSPRMCRKLLCDKRSPVALYKVACTGTPKCRGDESPLAAYFKLVGWCTCFTNRLFDKYICHYGKSDREHDGKIEEARVHCFNCYQKCF